MTGGIVTGGWEYVWAAYGISIVVFGVYGASLIARVRREQKRTEDK